MDCYTTTIATYSNYHHHYTDSVLCITVLGPLALQPTTMILLLQQHKDGFMMMMMMMMK